MMLKVFGLLGAASKTHSKALQPANLPRRSPVPQLCLHHLPCQESQKTDSIKAKYI